MRQAASVVAVLVSMTACSSSADTDSAPASDGSSASASSAPSTPTPITAPSVDADGDGIDPPPTVAAAVPPPRSSVIDPPDASTFGELGETDAIITGDRGTLQIGDVDVPAALPARFPLPDDLSIVLASEVGGSLGFTGETGLAFDDVVDFYRSGLAAAGYDVEDGQFVDGVVRVFAFEGTDGGGNVAVSTSPGGGTTVIVTFER